MTDGLDSTGQRRYPTMAALPPKVDLGFLPTPVVAVPRLSAAVGGPELLMKRDDLTGLAFGGNKTRKLEYMIRKALDQGCDSVITAGAAQSNHCRQTAAAASRCGLDCHLVLGGGPPKRPEGNLLLDRILGARIHWGGARRKGEDIPDIVDRLRAEGRSPFVIPYGGSNELGACGFVEGVMELESQIDTTGISHIVFASSSGGTQAGLMVGRACVGGSFKLLGIQIDKDPGPGGEIPRDTIVDLACRTAEAIGCGTRWSADDVLLDDSFSESGYGVVGSLERDAIALTARTEGILLDPVYTGRAMGGLIELIRSGAINRDDRILFWHTGGTPALFPFGDALLGP